MQDIVFYAAANETLGQVRDYSNMRSADAPLLTLGVAVCLRMRLFTAIEVPTPYPVASFSNIVDWQWNMDADFDRSTACKLVADEGNISVQTVTDTVNGETTSFTEFVIPISNMNTEELSTWLGNEKMKSGLTGELVGYDSEGYASFVLQIENFKVRNRVSGLCDPTALDQEIITRSQAEQIIQTTVSSSLATKQDKLTAANGGTGISVTNGGIISVSNVPQSAVNGLATAITNGVSAYVNSSSVIPVCAVTDLPTMSSTYAPLAEDGWTRFVSAGAGVTVTTNSNEFPKRDVTIALKDYDTIETATTGATITIAPGKAYKIDATTSSKTIAIDSFDAGKWGRESHIELFVANTGYVHVGENVTLIDALEPDAVNDLTVRFHDGHAIISVEDHVEAYMVNSTSTSSSTSGTLAYGIKQIGDTYKFIGFRSELNDSVVPTGGATATVVKHFVGNGADVGPTISGAIKLNSNGTFRDCKLNGLVISGGTATLGNVSIPNGATVSISGGGLAIDRVIGDGGTINLGGENVIVASNGSAYASGVIISGGNATSGGAFLLSGGASIQLHNVELVSNSVTGYAGALAGLNSNTIVLDSCYVHDNTNVTGVLYQAGATTVMYIQGSTIGTNQRVYVAGGKCVFAGSNFFTAILNGAGSCIISSGAIINMTGNANASPIAPTGGVVVSGGCTVINSAGASVNIAGGTYTKINKDGTTA